VNLTTALEFAREVAVLGGRIALGHYMREPEAQRKPNGSWVTEADWAAEAQIRLHIARSWPEHNILGEEEGLTRAGGGEPRLGAPTWVVDPIDGTHNYIAGIPVWATLVGLRVDGTNVVGACSAPALGELYDAAVDEGARCNDERIAVSPVASMGDAMVCLTGVETFIREAREDFLHALVTRCWRSRGFADFWGHMLVARGAAHITIETDLDLWDVAALEPIVVEAGGHMTHLDGSRHSDDWTRDRTCLTTNGLLHDDVVALWEGRAPSRV
jgi:histidinol-phosphatase